MVVKRDLQGKSVPPYVYPYKASGGLFSTVEDFARFLIAEMSSVNSGQQNVINEESLRAMQTPQINVSGVFGFVADAYGFGHFIETLPSGKKAVWHGGQGHGWMTHFYVIPETGDGIVIFTNSQRSWPFMATILKNGQIGAVGQCGMRPETLTCFRPLIHLPSPWIFKRD